MMPTSMTEGIDFRWAIGPYFVFPTANSKSAGRGTWQAGPAAASRCRPIPRLLISGLIQQATSFAYTSPDRTPVLNGSVAGEWMVYRQFAPRTEQFTLKFKMTLLFPTIEL
jgi:hypothetical protein